MMLFRGWLAGTVWVEVGMRSFGCLVVLVACGGDEHPTGGGDSGTAVSDTDSAGGDSGELPALDCPPDGTDDCCREPIGWAVVCGQTIPVDAWVPGRLTAWDPHDGGVFVGPYGAEHQISAWLDGDVVLPSVALDTPVEVWMQGWCEQGLFAMRTDDQRLIFAVGYQADGDVGDWSIDAGFDAETCVGRDDLQGCYERMHTSPVTVSHGGSSWSLMQGESASSSGATFTVGMFFSGTGDSLCDDGPGPSAAYWWITPDNGDSADLPAEPAALYSQRLGTCEQRSGGL